jgi:hypothetical protein
MGDQISVVHHQGAWRLFYDGHWRGRFEYRVDAEEAALRLLDRVRAQGRVASVYVQDRFGELTQRLPPEDLKRSVKA